MSGEESYSKVLLALRTQTEEIKSEIRQEAANTRNLLTAFDAKLKSLCDSVLQLERISRKNNVIVFGLQLDGSNLISETIDKLNTLLDLQLTIKDINDIYRINKRTNSPIKIEFISYLNKKLVLSSTKKLKGTNIYINNDLCKEDQERQKILRMHVNEAKSKGYHAYIRGGKLIVNNEAISPSKLQPQIESVDTDVETEPYALSNSAPSTPNPLRRQQELIVELYECEKPEQIPLTLDKTVTEKLEREEKQEINVGGDKPLERQDRMARTKQTRLNSASSSSDGKTRGSENKRK